MPRGKNHNEFIFVLDACSNPNFLRNTLDQIFVFKSLSKAENDSAQVILMNYPSPEGQDFTVLNSSEPVSLINDTIFQDLGEHLRNLPMNHPASDTWSHVIQYAVDSFAGKSDDLYIQTFFLVLISDFSTVKKDLTAFADKLSDLEISFIAVIEQDVTYAFRPILYRKHFIQAMENVQIPAACDSLGVQYMYEFAKSVGGVLTGPGDFLNFMTYLEVPPTKQDWNMKLQFGTYEFSTSTRKIIESPKPIVKRSFHKPECEYILAPKLGDLSNVDMTERLETVDTDKIVDAQLFHGQPVVIPKDVKDGIVASNVGTFKILGVVDSEELPEVYYGGDTTLAVCASEKSPRSVHFLEFVKKMFELKKYAIVVRIYRARTSARLFVLIPQWRGWFLMTNLSEGACRIVRPRLAPGDSVNVDKLSPAMAALREHLLSGSSSSLFHPRAQVDVHRLSVVDTVRRTCGYNIDCYQPARSFDFAEGISDEMKAILDQIFQGQGEGQSPNAPNADNDEDSGLPASEDEEDDW